MAALLSFTVNHRGRYESDDPSKVGERLIQTTQTAARSFIQSQKMRVLLTSSSQLVAAIREAMQISNTVQQLGVEVLDVSVGSIKKPYLEMAKALQAEVREQLLKEADEAIYVRCRNVLCGNRSEQSRRTSSRPRSSSRRNNVW